MRCVLSHIHSPWGLRFPEKDDYKPTKLRHYFLLWDTIDDAGFIQFTCLSLLIGTRHRLCPAPAEALSIGVSRKSDAFCWYIFLSNSLTWLLNLFESPNPRRRRPTLDFQALLSTFIGQFFAELVLRHEMAANQGVHLIYEDPLKASPSISFWLEDHHQYVVCIEDLLL